ncbi:hypothetical protein [Priestia flexa]|uniref:hypothetical protein n=1 Tax=Priestia flexa TaxID=86664 RepID=UPI001F4C8CE4|nr:hypothetical protein [Priestia flexa]
MVQHPVETAESIGEGVKAVWDDPKGVAKTIGNEIKDSWNEQVINGDAKSRGHYFSYLTANVAMSIVGTKGADKLAKTTKLEQLSGAATKKLNEGAAAIHVRTQSALQNLGLNGLDNRLVYPGVGSVNRNGGYQFIERVDGGNGVGTKVRDESGKGTGKSPSAFADRAKLEGHFDKHGKEFDGLYKNADEYLEGAKEVINNGIKVKYEYKGELRTGYVKFMGNNKNGKAKFEFVGTNNNGDITTYHTQSGKKIWKTINGENIPVINPAE